MTRKFSLFFSVSIFLPASTKITGHNTYFVGLFQTVPLDLADLIGVCAVALEHTVVIYCYEINCDKIRVVLWVHMNLSNAC